ncbi:MAG: hypothetical protein LBR53_03755 [Deltaproteobacteria bacterium]|jgi:hypothetical protein|nr:hypothetical protein [Deltaproteobacteria bacterium]
MQLDNRNTYNTLGRVGPHYPRPEYRPPQKEVTEGQVRDGSVKGESERKKAPSESLILSGNLKAKNLKARPETPVRLNLPAVRALVEETAWRITELPPKASYGCPHQKIIGDGLLYPTYV